MAKKAVPKKEPEPKECEECEKLRKALKEIEDLSRFGDGMGWFHVRKIAVDALR